MRARRLLLNNRILALIGAVRDLANTSRIVFGFGLTVLRALLGGRVPTEQDLEEDMESVGIQATTTLTQLHDDLQ